MANLTQSLTRSLTSPLTYALKDRLAQSKGVAFSPLAFFANGETGSWLDFNASGLVFQFGTGFAGTLASADGDPIGLVMDQGLWAGSSLAAIVAASPELFTDPNLDNPAVWTVDTGITISGGKASFSAAATSAKVYQTAVPTPLAFNALYRVSSTIANYSAGALSAVVRNSGVASLASANGLRTVYILGGAVSPATGTSSMIASGTTTLDVTDTSLKLIPGKHGSQGAGGGRPTLKIANGFRFARFNGTAFNLPIPAYIPTASGTMLFRVAIPASIAALQVIAGGTIGTTRCFIGVNTVGQLVAGIGTDDETIIKGSNDLRGQIITVGVRWNGTTVSLFEDAATVYSAAQHSTTGVDAVRLGATSNAGIAANFFAGDMYQAILTSDAITDAEYLSQYQYWETNVNP